MMINHWILVSLHIDAQTPSFCRTCLQPLDLPSLDARIAFLPCNFQVRWWIWRPEPCNHCVWRRWWLHSKLSFCEKSAAWTGSKKRKLLKMKMDHQLNMDHCLVVSIVFFHFIYVYLFVCFCKDWTWMLWLLNLSAISVIFSDQLKPLSKASSDVYHQLQTFMQNPTNGTIQDVETYVLFGAHECRVSSTPWKVQLTFQLFLTYLNSPISSGTCSQICRFPTSMYMFWGWQEKFCKQTHAITAI